MKQWSRIKQGRGTVIRYKTVPLYFSKSFDIYFLSLMLGGSNEFLSRVYMAGLDRKEIEYTRNKPLSTEVVVSSEQLELSLHKVGAIKRFVKVV